MSRNFEMKSVIHEMGQIAFEWEEVGGTYHVYREGKCIYEGTATNFKDTDVTPGNSYKYTIENHVEGVAKDIVMMQTSAFSDEKDPDSPLQSLVTTIIVAKSQIAISWERIKDTNLYVIYRNGKEIERVESNWFIDRDVEMDQPSMYVVYCERSVDQSEEKYNDAKSFVGKTIARVQGKVKQKKITVEGFTITKSLNSPSKLLVPVSNTQPSVTNQQWHFRYNTFLEDDYLENPNVISPNRYFKGDNRSFDPESDAFRTSVTIEVDMSFPKSALTFTKEVGESVGYGLDKKVRDRQTASDEKITMEKVDHGAEEIGFYLEHAVGNPLTTSPDINYVVQANFQKNGNYNLSGYHDQSPNHEIYIREGSEGQWISIHKSRNEGLEFMAGVTAYQHWRFLKIT